MDAPVTRDECDRKSTQILAAIAGLQASVSETNARLYRDNGHISIQTQLDRHDRILRTLCWVASIAGSTAIVGVVGLAWKIAVRSGVMI